MNILNEPELATAWLSDALIAALQTGNIYALSYDTDGVFYCHDVSNLEHGVAVPMMLDLLQERTGLSPADTKVLLDYGYRVNGVSYLKLEAQYGIDPAEFADTLYSNMPLDCLPPSPVLRMQLETLQRKMRRLMVSTNTPLCHPQRVLQARGLDGIFADRDIVSLCRAGFVAKPDPVFFNKLVEMSGITPPHMLVFDDNPAIVRALSAQGFWAVHITSAGEHEKVPEPAAHGHAPRLVEAHELILRYI